MPMFEGFFMARKRRPGCRSSRRCSCELLFCLLLSLLPAATTGAVASELFVVTTDYETGGFALIEGTCATTSAGTVFQDAVARCFGDRVYVVERLNGDAVLVFHKGNFRSPVIEFSTGSGTNPHDVLLIGESKAYVTLYEKSHILIVNPQNGSRIGTIDLSLFADADGIPEMDRLVFCDGKVFVSLQLLDRDSTWKPTGLSRIAVIDPETDSVVDTDPRRPGVQAIDLTLTNPIDMKYVPAAGKILVAEAGGFYSAQDGGLEYVDPATGSAQGILLTEQQLGGQLGGAFGSFSMVDADEGYAIIMAEDWSNTAVVRFDLSRGTVLSVHEQSAGFVHADLMVSGDMLYVCDRTLRSPGIRVFDTPTGREITASPLDTGLPPFCMAPLTDFGQASSPSPPPTPSPAPVPSPSPVPPPWQSGVTGKQFFVTGISSSAAPLLSDVIVFNNDGTCVLKKFELDGEGVFYGFASGLFYFIFTTHGGVSLQYVEAAGYLLPAPTGALITGFGTVMTDDTPGALVFMGVELFDSGEDDGL